MQGFAEAPAWGDPATACRGCNINVKPTPLGSAEPWDLVPGGGLAGVKSERWGPASFSPQQGLGCGRWLRTQGWSWASKSKLKVGGSLRPIPHMP